MDAPASKLADMPVQACEATADTVNTRTKDVLTDTDQSLQILNHEKNRAVLSEHPLLPEQGTHPQSSDNNVAPSSQTMPLNTENMNEDCPMKDETRAEPQVVEHAQAPNPVKIVNVDPQSSQRLFSSEHFVQQPQASQTSEGVSAMGTTETIETSLDDLLATQSPLASTALIEMDTSISDADIQALLGYNAAPFQETSTSLGKTVSKENATDSSVNADEAWVFATMGNTSLTQSSLISTPGVSAVIEEKPDIRTFESQSEDTLFMPETVNDQTDIPIDDSRISEDKSHSLAQHPLGEHTNDLTESNDELEIKKEPLSPIRIFDSDDEISTPKRMIIPTSRKCSSPQQLRCDAPQPNLSSTFNATRYIHGVVRATDIIKDMPDGISAAASQISQTPCSRIAGSFRFSQPNRATVETEALRDASQYELDEMDGHEMMDDDMDSSGEYVDDSIDYLPTKSSSRKRREAPDVEQDGLSKKRKITFAKNAREWAERQRLKYPNRPMGETWKRAEFVRIEQSSEREDTENTDPRFTMASFMSRDGGEENGARPVRIENPAGEVEVKKAVPLKQAALRQLLKENKGKHDIHKTRQTIKELEEDSKSFGFGKVKAVEFGSGSKKITQWELKGMPTALYSCQLIGVAHMVSRECGTEAPFGALVADEMGLGKTVQAIATCIANPPTKKLEESGRKTTLIVVPSMLRSQWEAELEKHGGVIGEIPYIYESKKTNVTERKLLHHHIVITTYWEVAQSLPSPNKYTIEEWKAKAKALKKDKIPFDWLQAYLQYAQDHKDECGILHQVNWYRIILDEGHYIKNYLSRTSRACVALKSEYSHIMSGTPIMNSYLEFFPLLMFLREPITASMSRAEFGKRFCDIEEESPDNVDENESGEIVKLDKKKPNTCTLRLECLISDIIIHRRMSDKLLNKPIVELPDCQKKIRCIAPHPAEQLLTEAFEFELQALMERKLDGGDERLPIQCMLSQIMRLRQLSGNADLIGLQIMQLFSIDQMRDLKERIKLMRDPHDKHAIPNALYDRFTLWIVGKKKSEHKTYAEVVVCCDGCKQQCDELQRVKKCKHLICDDCTRRLMAEAEENGDVDSNNKDTMLCPHKDCGKKFTMESLEDVPDDKPQKKKKASPKSKAQGKDARGFRPSPGPGQLYAKRWLEKIDSKELKVLPSSKLNATIHQVQYWLDNNKDDKIIIFSQFKQFQTLLGIMLEKAKIKFLYFTGDMSHMSRDTAVNFFYDQSKGIKVLLSGLKCGGVGLNLTCANRVIITDPWWNTAVDNQAFGRIYRMGQKKNTHQRKTIVLETMDSRMIELQLKKEAAIGHIMQDEPTLEEWKELLGRKKCLNWKDFLDSFEIKTLKDDGIEDDFIEAAQNTQQTPMET